MGVVTVPESKQSVAAKRAFRPSSSIRHTPQWPVSDVTSDLTIEVGSASFSLHKFPLVSRSGRIRKLVLESKDKNLNLAVVPGGSESFELAAKFCYGVGVQFNSSNIAALRCVAHYLEMTEELSEKNLEARTEAYLKDSIFNDISNSITVLHSSERLLPVAEEINLVGRLVNAIAVNACKEQLASGLLKLDQNFSCGVPETEKPCDWWGRSLPILKLDFFQRVLSAMKSKGLNHDIISDILMSYARKSLQIIREPSLVKSDSDLQRKQRIVLEAVVGLLPTQANKSSIPISFLSSLLKTAIGSGTSVSCRSDLERRISHQLDQAILEDILIPANMGAMYDTDSVQRIFSMFLNLDECDYRDDDDDEDAGDAVDESEMAIYDFEGAESPKQSSIFKVSKLMDSYLAEVALDSSLPPSKFIALAELLPDHARVLCDGLYRAVDIFLKVHPHMKDSERYRLCKTVSCKKLSQDASSHAAQNERLPVQIAVQVLFYEQTRLKNAMTSGGGTSQSQFFLFTNRSGSGMASGAISPRDNYASVRRENRELRLEVARMRMRLTDLEKDHVSMKKDFVKPQSRRRRYGMLRKLSRGLNKLNAIVLRFRSSQSKHTEEKTNSERRFMFQKRRCHSVS
ncbi:phototropic-responsive NPH3 family protein [Arabidopsis lyrata subsp. lyrata]|uniref:Phototropic-responsive NPH3 family protein n=1 Tax=Arabidopsis lyrata subsp. lyrata TaxID=81972 RepID=D7LHD0_ARALL|nr:phototropic-responsive NPH3 family protein [Arabidopsis lyrata subsp. lyrata]